MADRRGRYYLARVIKMGILDQQRLMDAIARSAPQRIGKFYWTITNVIDKRDEENGFVYGRLSKYAAEGHLTVVDTSSKSEIDAIAPNLVIASAPFVYLPQFSGIAYLHVWNEIQDDLFPRRFKRIIEQTLQGFFVECNLEPVSDYRAFSAKLESIERFTEISAKVHPPNPLFGRLWEPLDAYMRQRNADELTVRESQSSGSGLKTQIIVLIRSLLMQPTEIPTGKISQTDAALLMAADGYGAGKVVGKSGETEIVVRTADTQKSFMFAREPEPAELARAARDYFDRISKERDMQHGNTVGREQGN